MSSSRCRCGPPGRDVGLEGLAERGGVVVVQIDLEVSSVESEPDRLGRRFAVQIVGQQDSTVAPCRDCPALASAGGLSSCACLPARPTLTSAVVAKCGTRARHRSRAASPDERRSLVPPGAHRLPLRRAATDARSAGRRAGQEVQSGTLAASSASRGTSGTDLRRLTDTAAADPYTGGSCVGLRLRQPRSLALTASAENSWSTRSRVSPATAASSPRAPSCRVRCRVARGSDNL